MPTEYYKRNFRVTSEFGPRGDRQHRGVDLGRQRSGDPILSLNPGVVKTSGYGDREGYYIVVEQSDGTTAKYMHMQEAPRFRVGETVNRGDDLGKVGATGSGVSGPHLHLEVLYQGKHVNPLKYLDFGVEAFIEPTEVETNSLDSYEDRQDAAIKYFIDKGYTPQAAIGIVGNLSAESSLNHKAERITSKEESYGLAQWNNMGSRDRVLKFEEVIGKDIKDAGYFDHLDFVDWEIRNDHTIAKKDLFGRLNDPNNSSFDTTKMFTVEYERAAEKYRQDDAILGRLERGEKSWEEYQKREVNRAENIASNNSYEGEGWMSKTDVAPQELQYSSRDRQPQEGQEIEEGTYYTEEELFGDISDQENFTTLQNREKDAIFADAEYRRARDEKEDREKEEKEERERRQSEATAAENQLREETKKKRFLMEFAMKSLDYQAPTYHRVGKQAYTNEQNS